MTAGAAEGEVAADARFALLRERQKEILRLVPWFPNSAAIARRLTEVHQREVSPATVDKQIKLAMRTLGVNARGDAARLLIEHEAGVLPSDPQKQDLPRPQLWPLPPPVPTVKRPHNDLTLTQILILGFAIAITVPLLLIAGAAVLTEANRIFAHH